MADQANDPVVVQQPIVADQSQTKTIIGLSGLTLPTPERVKAIFKMITFFVIIIPIVFTGISTIPVGVKQQVLEYMGVVVLILQKAEDFWGIQVN